MNSLYVSTTFFTGTNRQHFIILEMIFSCIPPLKRPDPNYSDSACTILLLNNYTPCSLNALIYRALFYSYRWYSSRRRLVLILHRSKLTSSGMFPSLPGGQRGVLPRAVHNSTYFPCYSGKVSLWYLFAASAALHHRYAKNRLEGGGNNPIQHARITLHLVLCGWTFHGQNWNGIYTL
jgi:hypothetical protein